MACNTVVYFTGAEKTGDAENKLLNKTLTFPSVTPLFSARLECTVVLRKSGNLLLKVLRSSLLARVARGCWLPGKCRASR